MKTKFFLLAITCCLVATFSSCQKCESCTDSSGNVDKFCSSNSTDRDNFAKAHTLLGQTCNETTTSNGGQRSMHNQSSPFAWQFKLTFSESRQGVNERQETLLEKSDLGHRSLVFLLRLLGERALLAIQPLQVA